MCVAIYKPRAAKLTKEVLAKCFKQNSDGCGFALYVHNPPEGKKPYIWQNKGYFNFEQFWKEWEKFQVGYDAIIHFRIATHGSVREENCHPFVFKARTLGTDGKETQYAFAHNGVMSHFSALANKLPGDKSDTRIFGERVLEGLAVTVGPKFLEDTRLMAYVAERLSGNKVVIMRDDGYVHIVNETAGTWKDMEGGKVWFSNTHWDTFRDSTGSGRPSSGVVCARNLGPYLAGGWFEGDDDDTANTSSAGEEQWNAHIAKHATTRATRREREDFVPTYNDGMEDATGGEPLFYPREPRYVAGYFSIFERRASDALFTVGYADSMAGNRLKDIKGAKASATYRLGFYWAEFEHDARGKDDTTLDRLVRTAPLPGVFQGNVQDALESMTSEDTGEATPVDETKLSEAEAQAAANKAILESTGTPTFLRRH